MRKQLVPVLLQPVEEGVDVGAALGDVLHDADDAVQDVAPLLAQADEPGLAEPGMLLA
ncbi:hypothetical protein [Nonomuraea basaltis]|uniref:hypothetical protein n=1 Tax=Nonomuraea basaltis TaxID=2495887 RepID=UPI00148613CE|nr:hypothetical protein [Nonomuraea basaltis]